MITRKLITPRGEFNLRQGGNPNGPTVVMLHGWPESSYCWESVTSHLNPSLHIIAPDLRGPGDSERILDVKMRILRGQFYGDRRIANSTGTNSTGTGELC
ncbi:MAG: alpha/beta fold hydrolase [Desulfobacteraceae bacterium]